MAGRRDPSVRCRRVRSLAAGAASASVFWGLGRGDAGNIRWRICSSRTTGPGSSWAPNLTLPSQPCSAPFSCPSHDRYALANDQRPAFASHASLEQPSPAHQYVLSTYLCRSYVRLPVKLIASQQSSSNSDNVLVCNIHVDPFQYHTQTSKCLLPGIGHLPMLIRIELIR